MSIINDEMLDIAQEYEDLSATDQRLAKLLPDDAADYTRRALEHQMQAERIRAEVACGAYDRLGHKEPYPDHDDCQECGERIGRNGYFCSGCYDHLKAVGTERRVDEWLEANDK